MQKTKTLPLPALGGRLTPWMICLVLAVLTLAATAGLDIVRPGNIAWLSANDDQAETYLGWEFYRKAPRSGYPGSNPSYGLELSSGIFYADSIPLLAMPLKLISNLLPDPFQYHGLWILACFFLQAYFAWRLLALTSLGTLQKSLALVLFLFAPPLLFRLGRHNDLLAHWLLLAGIYLHLGPPRRFAWLLWLLTLLAAALIHSYLFAMVTVLWIADLAKRFLFKESSGWSVVLEAGCGMAAAAAALWGSGFFSIHSGVIETGFGYYHMNLLSLFDSSGWSYVLPDLPEKRGNYEGFNFLGLGLLLLVGYAAVLVVRGRMWTRIPRRAWPLIVAAAALAAFAVSNVIAVGTMDVEIPLPQKLLNLANLLRSSGRTFWPAFYLIVFAALLVLSSVRMSRRHLTVLFGLAALLQVADTSAGWLPRRSLFAAASQWEGPLRSPFWELAADRYTKLRAIPVERWGQNWKPLTYYAARHGMGTDLARLSRIDTEAMDKAAARAEAAIQSGRFDSDSLYILDDDVVKLAEKTRHRGDLLQTIDGFNVLAPGFCAPKPLPPCTAADTGANLSY